MNQNQPMVRGRFVSRTDEEYEEFTRQRILSRVDTATGCWVWTGQVGKNGYGQIGYRGRYKRAHRVSYEVFRGPIPIGLDIHHHCSVRACVNPDHLEPMTRAENLRAGLGTKLTQERVDRIRELLTETIERLAEECGVSKRQVCSVAIGESWKAR